MARRQRDYRAEYARRIKRGSQRGLTRSQARGHPGAGQTLASQPTKPPAYDRRLEAGFKAIQNGKALSAAAKELHVSPERLRQYLRAHAIAERRGRKWVALADQRSRRMLLYTKGEARTLEVNRPGASGVGLYMAAVGEFLMSNDAAHLLPYVDRGVTDVRGTFHPFETNPNTLYRLAHMGGESFEQIYRIVV